MSQAELAFARTPVTLDGVTRTVEEWCTIKNLSINTVRKRRSRFKPWAESFSPPTPKEHSPFRKEHNAHFANAVARKQKKTA